MTKCSGKERLGEVKRGGAVHPAAELAGRARRRRIEMETG